MIRSLIFDMGNVLLDYNPRVCLDLYLEREDDKKRMMTELFSGPEWIEKDRGRITDQEMEKSVAQRLPARLHGPLRQCVENWQICMKPLKGAKEFLTAVKQAGYGVFLLSNASQKIYDYFPSFLPFDFFDGAVISSDVHLLKPDPAIYRHLLEKYRLDPAECLLIDDRADNLEGAASVGIKGFLFEGDFPKIGEF